MAWVTTRPFFVSKAQKMSVSELIKKFDVLKKVPVDVNDVIAELRARGIEHEIYFWPADINDERLKGQLVQIDYWDYPLTDANMDGPTKTVADIYYCKSMSEDEQRLVCCKELLHILDPAGCRAATEEEITRLFQKIGLPPEMQDAAADGAPVSSDRVALYEAVAVLFPYATRQLLMKPYKEEKITLADIARLVDIPYKYVAFVMHDVWDRVHIWKGIMRDGSP